MNVLNRYLAAAADAVLANEGTIDKFLGDAVMAWFNAPIPQPDHTLRAVKAALGIRASVQRLQHQLPPEFRLSFGAGIYYGEAVLGLVGTEKRTDYTAIGDTTNLAARMESMAEPGTVMVSPETYKQVAQQFEFSPKGKTAIKGKDEALDVYVLVKEKIDRPRLGMERQIFSEMVGRDKELNKLELQINKAIDGPDSLLN